MFRSSSYSKYMTYLLKIKGILKVLFATAMNVHSKKKTASNYGFQYTNNHIDDYFLISVIEEY